MKKKNWTSITANTGKSGLPDGCYVLVITNVTDNSKNEYLEVEWDVAEGEHKGHYGDEWGARNAWAHTFKVSYKDTAEGLFKHFLTCIEESNPSFSIAQWEQTSNEYALIGKLFGAGWGTERYTYNGEDRTRRTFPDYFRADEVRSGKAKRPADRDTRGNADKQRTKTVITTGGEVYEDVPF